MEMLVANKFDGLVTSGRYKNIARCNNLEVWHSIAIHVHVREEEISVEQRELWMLVPYNDKYIVATFVYYEAQ